MCGSEPGSLLDDVYRNNILMMKAQRHKIVLIEIIDTILGEKVEYERLQQIQLRKG